MTRSTARVLALVIAVAAVAELTPAAEPPRGDEPGPIVVRRMFVPGDIPIESWPFPDDRPYIPLAGPKFEALWKESRQASTRGAVARGAALEKLALVGRLESNLRLAGTAELTVRALTPIADRTPLAPLSPAVVRARWKEGEQPALLGTEPDGTPQLTVEKSGTLLFDWFLATAVDPTGVVTADLSLPSAAAVSLELDVPATYELEAEGAVIETRPPAPKSSTQVDRRWKLKLSGGSRRLSFRPLRNGIVAQVRQTVRQSAVYDLSERGVEASFELRIDALSPLDRVDVRLDDELTLIDIRSSDKVLNWTTSTTGGKNYASIELDRPLHGANRSIFIRALGPSSVGTRRRLPILRTEGLFWQRGTLTVVAPAPLRIDRIDVVDGLAAAAVPLTGGRSGEAVEIQCFSPDTTAEVLLSRPAPSIEQTSVVVADVKPNDLSIQHRCRLQVTGGEVFTIDIEVPARWIVDSVTTVPSSALENWRSSDERDGKIPITLYFSQAITPERPVRLTVAAHARRTAVGKPLERSDLAVVSFVDVRDAAPLAAVRTDASLRRDVEFDDELASPILTTLDPLRRELLGEFADEQLLDLSVAAPTWRLRLSRRVPKYDARIEQVAAAGSAGLAERYRIEVLNRESLPIDRLQVRLRPAKTVPPQWSLGDSRQGRIEARRIVSVPADPADDSEVWQIDLRRSTTGDVVVFADRATPWSDDKCLVSFAAVVDAAAQTGELVVEAEPSLPLVLWPLALTPIPVNSAEDASQAAVRGSYRFDPKESVNRDALSMSIDRAASALPTGVARVWSRRIASQVENGSRLIQRTRFFVHAVGEGACRLTFPPLAGDAEIRFDGEPVEFAAGVPVVIRFPADRSSFVLDASFSRSISGNGAVRIAELPLVEIDLPVLHTAHQLLVPLAYDVPVDSRLRALSDDSQADFVRRLAGPWARSPVDRGASSRNPAAAREADAEIARALRTIGTVAAAARREGRRITWESLWSEVVRQRTAEMPPIRFDAASLWSAEIGPRDPVPLPELDFDFENDDAGAGGMITGATGAAGAVRRRDGATADWGERLLGHAGLKIAEDEGTLVVSAVLFVETRGNALRVFQPQADSLDADPDRRTIDFDAWRREPASPWRHVDDPGADRRNAGGAGHVVSLSPATKAVWLVRREVPAVIAFAVVLVAFACGRKLAATRRGTLVMLLAAVAVVACLTPTWIGVIATSALIGLAAALVVEIVLPQRRIDGEVGLGVLMSPKSVHESGLKRAAVTGLVLIFASFGIDAVRAQAPAPPIDPPTYEIFIPVNKDNKPNGADYYVPEELRRLLADRAAPNAPAAAQPVLWLRADYQTQLARDTGQTRFVAVEVKATFELDVPAPNTPVRVPLGGFDDASLRPVLVDGRLVDVRRIDGALELTVPQAGRRVTLEFIFRPDLPASNGRSGFQLDIPPVLDSRIRVALPAELSAVEVAEAAEPAAYADDRRTATVRLKPASRLTVRWDDQRSTAEPSVIVEQLTWLKIRPGSTVVDARFRLRPLRPMSELTLVADPRLQWLPKFGGKSPIADVRSTPIVVGQATVAERVTVVFAKPITEESLVDVSFLVTGASGTGKLRLPELKPANDVPQRRYFAYSVDPQLESAVTGASGLPAIAVPEFAKAWGEAEGTLPQAAYAIDIAAGDWTLTTKPMLPKLRAASRQTLACGRRRIDVVWDADLTVERSSVSRYELDVPPQVEVTSVELAEVNGDAGQILRWSRDAAGTIVAFLRAPLGGKHKLSLRGHVAVPEGGDLPLPIVNVRADSYAERIIQVVRLHDARATVEKPADLAPYVAAVVDDRLANTGRPVATLVVSGPKPASRLRVQPNVDRFKIRGVVTLLDDRTDWDFELTAHVETTQGLVDELDLELPPQIALPLAVTPAMPHEVVPGATGEPRRVVLRPRAAIDGKFSFTIKAPLSADPSGAPVPAPRVRGAEAEEYFFRLPSTVGVHVARWDTVQLAPATLPENLVAAPTAAEFVVLRSVGNRPSARLHILAGAQGRPFVRYADHRLSPEEGGYFGVSSFLVEPAGMKAFVIRVPPSLEIVQAVSGGATASVLPAGDSLWKIATASDEMPHYIDVAYRSRTGWGATQASANLVVPSPGEQATSRAFWTIVEPDALRISPVDEKSLDRPAFLRERMRLIDSAFEGLSNRGGRGAADEWRAPLGRRRIRDRDELARILPEPDTASSTRSGAASSSPSKSLPSLFDGAVSPYARVMSVSTGELSELAVRIDSPTRAPIGRLAPAVACVLCVLLWRLFRAVDGPMRWPHLVGVLIGAAWLAWLRPQELGWVIIVAVLATRLHSAIRPARTEAPVTVRPLTVGR
jgi:chromate transport protein ChrA